MSDSDSCIDRLEADQVPVNDNAGRDPYPEFSQPLPAVNSRQYLDPAVHELTDDKLENYGNKGKSRSFDLFCFHCNRPEWHVRASVYRWGYLFLVGLTFGLIKYIGPYYCKCCGHPRLMWSNNTNPRFWLMKFQNYRQTRKVRRRKARRRSH